MFPVDHKLWSTVLPAPISHLLSREKKLLPQSLSSLYTFVLRSLIDLSRRHLSSISRHHLSSQPANNPTTHITIAEQHNSHTTTTDQP